MSLFSLKEIQCSTLLLLSQLCQFLSNPSHRQTHWRWRKHFYFSRYYFIWPFFVWTLFWYFYRAWGRSKAYEIIPLEGAKLAPVKFSHSLTLWNFEAVNENHHFTTYRCWDKITTPQALILSYHRNHSSLRKIQYIRFHSTVGRPTGEPISFLIISISPLEASNHQIDSNGNIVGGQWPRPACLLPRDWSGARSVGPIYRAGKVLIGA